MNKTRKIYIDELYEKIDNIKNIYFLYCISMDKSLKDDIHRFFHSIKGTAATLGFKGLAKIGVEMDEAFKDQPEENMVSDEFLVRISRNIGMLVSEYDRLIDDGEEIYKGEDKYTSKNLIGENSVQKKVIYFGEPGDRNREIIGALKMEGVSVDIEGELPNFFELLGKTEYKLIILDADNRKHNIFNIYESIEQKTRGTRLVFISGNDVMEEALKISKLPYLGTKLKKDEIIRATMKHIEKSGEVNENTVLVVDDEAVLISFVEGVLREEGYNVITTSDPLKVIDIVNKNKIDVILLDVMMMKKNGFEVFNQIRNMDHNIPVIFMTGMEIIEETLKFSDLEYMKKPIDINQLLNKVKNAASERLNKDVSIKTDSIKEKVDNFKPVTKEFHKLNSKLKVLVIDDEKVLVDLIQNSLSSEKFEMFSAFDGEAGLQKFREIAPDIIIVDLMLPKLGGLEVCRAIKNDSRIKAKILVLSSKRKEEDIIKCFEVGVDDYILKPFNLMELEARIRRLV